MSKLRLHVVIVVSGITLFCNFLNARTIQTEGYPYGRPSWQAQGYYGVMGGEPPLGWGYTQAGSYSYSMGFRRFPN